MNRILIISNACFSDTDSNGRTLAQLFSGYSPEELAQFYVYGKPDLSICKHYYQVSDRDAFLSFIKQKSFGGKPQTTLKDTSRASSVTKKKTPLRMLIRELVWKYGKWNGVDLAEWLADFQPSAIFLFLGDNAFLPSYATNLAKQCNIPIIAYSTEEYYFKDYNYLTKHPSLFYWYFSRILRRAYHKSALLTHIGIFNTPSLMIKYANEFSYPCKCIMPKTDIEYLENWMLPRNEDIQISYLGNLGLKRHKALMEIADEVQAIIPGKKLQVYGKLPDEAKDELNSHPFIDYMGFVEYDDVVKIMHSSTLLLHAEYNDEFYNRDLRYAFSTKIADSICSGTPLLLYANGDLAETAFVKHERCGFVAEKRENLNAILSLALQDEDARREKVFMAKSVGDKYFRQQNELMETLCSLNDNHSNRDYGIKQ